MASEITVAANYNELAERRNGAYIWSAESMGPNALEMAQTSADNCSTVILFTGLSGSGKTSVGETILRSLREVGDLVLLLDGDTFRRDHAPDLGFSREDRAENLRRAGLIARAAADAGSIVLLSFIAPYATDRERLRKQMVPHCFFEVWLSAPVEVCEQRDVKGLYKRARSKDLASFTGVTDTYEPPVNPDHVLPTHLWSLDQCCESLLSFVGNLGLGESGVKDA